MLSVVIPFYNEEKRMKSESRMTTAIDYMLKELKDPFELVLANDGSTDNTINLLEDLKNQYSDIPIQIVSYSQNQGKGHAVKLGVLASKGGKIIVMDADISIDLAEMHKFIKELDEYDIVIGSKKHFLTQTKKSQNAPRRILGKGYTLITNIFLGLNFTDITCGFKGFKANAAKSVFEKQRINRFAYDSETLFLAKKLGFSIKELPVSWYHIEGSTVSTIIDTWRSLRDLFLILFNYYYGNYNKKAK